VPIQLLNTIYDYSHNDIKPYKPTPFILIPVMKPGKVNHKLLKESYERLTKLYLSVKKLDQVKDKNDLINFLKKLQYNDPRFQTHWKEIADYKNENRIKLDGDISFFKENRNVSGMNMFGTLGYRINTPTMILKRNPLKDGKNNFIAEARRLNNLSRDCIDKRKLIPKIRANIIVRRNDKTQIIKDVDDNLKASIFWCNVLNLSEFDITDKDFKVKLTPAISVYSYLSGWGLKFPRSVSTLNKSIWKKVVEIFSNTKNKDILDKYDFDPNYMQEYNH